MLLEHCVLAWCLLSAPGLPVVQSQDKLTGTWTGALTPPNAQGRMPVVVTLKLAPDGTVTGTITGPPRAGDIKSGTFDRNTGALKLVVTVRGDDAATSATMEGKVRGDTASGKVDVNGELGDFHLVKGAVAAPPPVAPPTEGPTAMVARGFAEVSGWVLRAAELVPADKYGYRPVGSVRTFGQLVAHIADSHNYYCARAAGNRVEWSDAIEKGTTSKAELVQKLRHSIDGCAAGYAGAGQIGPLTENFGHTNLHYGNLITYIRMLGLVPPSS